MLLLHELRDDADEVCRRLDAPLPLTLPDGTRAVAIPQSDAALIVSDDYTPLALLSLGDSLPFGTLSLRLTEGGDARTDRLRALRPSGGLALRVDSTRRFALQGPRVTLGRAPGCHLRLDDAAVSGAHAELVCEGARWALRDLRSTNGVRLNGARVREAWIERGDVITLGHTSLRVEGDGDASGRDDELVGDGEAMRALRAEVARYAEAPYPVLVQGESGSGKELVARALHRASPRAAAPFVAVNCGALSPEVVESELFGHERGAFTGAVGRRRGLFEEASGGTLFLDEVGELSLSLQTRLLRVLETGEVRRVGAEGVTPVDVRVVCATWRDLDAMSLDGTFREDLLFRLAVLRLRVPSLRERAVDVPALCMSLLDRIEAECGRRRVLEDRALALLTLMPWRGNVRELLAVLRRAVFLSDGRMITARHVEQAAPEGARAVASGALPPPRLCDDGAGLRALFERLDGNVSQVSKVTGLARSTVRSRLARRDGEARDSAGSARYDQRR
ncbi:MAG: sigma 54-interacting transcriptional regulator [Polyangiales bacterium]